MRFTDDEPRMLQDINPAIPSSGPVFLSNHSQLGFNVRHFYQHWQTGQWRATKKGIAINPADAIPLVREMVAFINEIEIYPGRRYRLIEVTEETTDLDEEM